MSPATRLPIKLSRRQLIALLGIAALIVMTLMAYLIWSSYQDAIRTAETTTRNYAAIIEARLDATLRRADGDLQELVHKIPIAALSRQAVPRYARELNADLDSRLVNFPELAGVRIFDANGDRLYTTASGTAPRTHISDRNYFRLLRDNPGAGLVFSEVIISRSRNQPSMVAARALRDAQGAFHGIVFVAIDLGYFQKLFRSLDIGTQGTVSLRRSDDQTLILRWPHLADAVNRPLNAQNPTVLRLAAGEKMTTQHITAETDGIARIFSTHALERYPLYVNVAVGRNEVLAAWRSNSLAVGLSGLLLLGLLTIVLYWLWRTETALRERDEWFGAAFEQAAVGMALRDIDPRNPRLLRVNQKLCDILGYTREELQQMTSIDLTPPDDRHLASDYNERLMQGEITGYSREKRYLHKSGHPVWTEISLSAVHDGGGRPIHAMAVIQDITSRKQAEETQAKLAAIVETSNDAIISRSLDDTIMSWNVAAERMFGYTETEAVGQSIAMIFPPDRKEEVARNRALLAQGRAILDLETVRLAKDGRRIDVSLSQSPIKNDSGAMTGVALVFRDISERRRAHESQAQLAAIIATSNDAIISRGLDYKITSWNATAERLFGYTAAEAIGQDAFILVPSDRKEENARNRALLAQGRSVLDLETVRLAKDGRRIDVSLSQSPIRDDSGKMAGVALIFRDISERKRAFEAQARLAAIVENASDAIIGRSLDGTITSWNAAAERLFGYSAAEAIGRDLRMTPPEMQHEFKANRERVRMGEVVSTYDTALITKDGRRIQVARNMSPIKDQNGNTIGMAAIVRDITKARQAEAQIRLAASVVDNAAEGIMITDRDNNIVSVNRAFTEITGYTAAEVIGKNPRLLSSGEQSRKFYEEMWDSIRETGRWRGEIWDKRKNGEAYCELLSISAVRDGKGEITHHCGVFGDITQLKITEAELMSVNAALEERVAARTRDLERANRELEAFSYSVSHDLRAPLRHISGFSAIVIKANEGKLDNTSVDHLRRIAASAQRMAGLIDDLLQLSRISRQPMRRQTVDLSELSTEVIGALARPERHVDVVITPAMTVEGDPGLLHIALENLLGNAWKFTEHTAGARIEVGRLESGGEPVYFVRDNGAGFDMKYAQNLFGAFQRMHTQEEFEGSGIGLSIVQRIVTRHNGRIWAEAKVDEGATLYFTLWESNRSAAARAP